MDADSIREALKRYKVPHGRIAGVIGRERSAATKLLSGVRSIKAAEMEPLSELVAEFEQAAGESSVTRRATSFADQFGEGLLADYVAVDVLPTYAGAGGGGTGEDEQRRALLPRQLVVDELRARPEDVILVPIRGDSMEPDYFQGDWVLADRRDVSPVQPGPFALWDGDGYVLKNIERIPRTNKLRVFSTNPRYRDYEADPEDIRIMGRPVWFARRS